MSFANREYIEKPGFFQNPGFCKSRSQPPRFSQVCPKRLVKKAIFVQLAKLLEQRQGDAKGQDVGRQVLAHGAIGGAEIVKRSSILTYF